MTSDEMTCCRELTLGVGVQNTSEKSNQLDDPGRENVYNKLSRGDFLSVISEEDVTALAKKYIQPLESPSRLSDETSTNGKDDSESLLITAIAALQLFVQHNWTGPVTLTKQHLADLMELDLSKFEETEAELLEKLAVDGEAMYERVNFPSLLAISRNILSAERHHPKSLLWLVWELRSVYVHQSMIDERCNTFKTEAMYCVNSLMSAAGITKEAEPVLAMSSLTQDSADTAIDDKVSDSEQSYPTRPCQCLRRLTYWQLEAASQSRYYFEHKTCQTLLDNAKQQCDVDVKLDGVPGRRTRYQNRDIAQLVLSVSSKPDADSQSAPQYDRSVCENVLTDELLNDDTVLDNIEISDSGQEREENVDTDWLQQSLILALCEEGQYVKASDTEITEEETLAYLSYLLSHPVDWSIQCKALLLRSIMQKGSGRRVERSFRQLELLSDIQTRTKAGVSERLRAVYTVSLPPAWQLQRSLGELQMDVGAHASAMEVFDRLGLWYPLIVCSQRAGRTGKAEELIRKRLAVKETAPLYCSLSDVTGDPQYWHSAWELSKHRSARAVRGLALHHLRATEFETSIGYFEKTLALNPLQVGCWFSFGCASLACAQYDKAATAFRRCVILNSDNFEAWNNLAAAYIRSNQKARGFAVLQDAIKCSFDNWRVWENYSLVGCDCGQITEVIRAAHRILELKNKWEDEMVVKHLTKCIMDDIVDASGTPSSQHLSAMLKLLGHTTAKVTTNSVIWACYGRLILHSKDSGTDNIERGIQCLQKAYRCATAPAAWEKTLDLCTTNSDLLLELVSAYQLINTKKYASTGKLQIKSHVARLRKAHTDPVTKVIASEVIQEQVTKLEEALVLCEELAKNG